METTPKPRGGKKVAQTDFPVSQTFADGMDAIANGVIPTTTTFEASSKIGTIIILRPRRSPSVVVHDTKGLIADEITMAAVTADAQTLGIYPFGQTEEPKVDKPDDTPIE